LRCATLCESQGDEAPGTSFIIARDSFSGSYIDLTFTKSAFLMVAAMVSAASAPVFGQSPNPPPPAPASTSSEESTAAAASEADEAAALIAKANAAAAAKAKIPAAPATASGTTTGPTPEALRKAKDFGFHAELFSGQTFFCREDATVGTRIKNKRCIDASQFEDYAVQLQIARDTIKKDVCQGGNVGPVGTACGGLK
jgi:hypothetical protein